MNLVRASRDGPSDQDVHANGAPGAFNWDFDKDHGFYSECVPGCDMSRKELPETNNRLYEFSCRANGGSVDQWDWSITHLNWGTENEMVQNATCSLGCVDDGGRLDFGKNKA